jgi:DNA-binding NarL/FixJ family response regulator
MRVVAEAATAAETLREMATRELDAILLDLSFPDGTGFDVLREMRERKNDVPVVVFTNALDAADRCVEAGAKAFVSKESGLDELRVAINAAVDGKRFIGARGARFVDDVAGNRETAELPHLGLSSREMQIMLLLVRGSRPKEIACELQISEKTVATHRARLMRKLDVSDNRQLLLYALKAGLTDWS